MKSLIYILIMSVLLAGCSRRIRVSVDLDEGSVKVRPEMIDPANRIIFEVTNVGSIPHQFVVVRATFAPDALPIEDDRVRYYTFTEGPEMITFYRHESGEARGFSHEVSRGQISSEMREVDSSYFVLAPGEVREHTDVFQCDARFRTGTSFILFCNLPGHYQQGEYTVVSVK